MRLIVNSPNSAVKTGVKKMSPKGGNRKDLLPAARL